MLDGPSAAVNVKITIVFAVVNIKYLVKLVYLDNSHGIIPV